MKVEAADSVKLQLTKNLITKKNCERMVSICSTTQIQRERARFLRRFFNFQKPGSEKPSKKSINLLQLVSHGVLNFGGFRVQRLYIVSSFP